MNALLTTPRPTSAAPGGSPRPGADRSRSLARGVGVQVVLWAYAAVAFGPLLLVLIGSFRSNAEILRAPVGLPSSFDVSNYTRAWETASISTYFLNSLAVTAASVVLCVGVSALAAYALARWRFRGRALLAAFFLSGLMIPAKLGLLPVFYMFQSMNLIDSRIGLVLLYAASGVPFSVFVIMGFMRGLPGELEEAARIDGAHEGRLFVSIVLPLMRPALAVVTVFQFAPTWNDFFYPLVLLRSGEKYTIPVGLTRFFGEFAADRGTLFAGLVIALVPLAVVFALATRQIVAGLTAGMSR
ncbi:carbohydrate ABC transporter permease [Micromonospora sagamiensis]|uniref:Raffinose/stachyose/melibiose transport system permease protein n=1 Tax=Micromonospora sagamiensis TaxID=47875 RepID=A0A562WJ40_9ACTN|nr:carbohydrate ABC transporter permease [Micromonospora sagamiensis]TWJ29554.1 raffinose/stachyose/melibiose transport system permease protein [Micromonospora sagamiensis]BCL17417.1 sugar ABC transporter permease [Micromonospora sagamiensis]